jgi:hypothetical protein
MPTTPIIDVLDLILQLCSISSLAVISRVSFHTRELALPHLLRRVYLDRNPQQVLTFLNFILDNAHDSDLGIISKTGRHVFELELDTLAFKTTVLNEGVYKPVRNEKYPISTWALMLAKALRLMPNLRSFTLRDETEEIVTYSPDFGPTLLSLPELTSLILWGIGPNTSLSFGKAIDTLKGATKLQALNLSVMSDEEEMEVVVHEGVGRFLSHYSVHLTDLSLCGLDLSIFLQEDERRPDNSRVTFPALGKLQIENCELSLEGLATAFPALHTLHHLSMFLRPNSTAPRRNQVSFPNLISITGRYRDIDAILNSNASRDHVRRAVITSGWDDDDDIATSAYAVPKAAPHLKSLHFSQSYIKPLAWWQGFGETLPELTYLDITLYVRNGLDLIVSLLPNLLHHVQV